MTRTLAAIFFLAPLAAQADCAAELKALKQVTSQDPTAVAKSAIARGELKFLGVAGYTILVPGVDRPKCTARRDRVNVIEGTSDTPCTIASMDEAIDFARRHNLVMKAHLDAKRVKYERCAL